MRERGFALLLVLWTLVLLTVITTRLIGAGRDEARLSGNLRAAAAAEMVADAAVHEAMFHLLDRSPGGWVAGGGARRVVLPGGEAAVTVEDEAARVNPNQASEALLRALLQGVGADAGTARAVAGAMLDWRSKAGPGTFKAAEYRAAGREYGPPETPFRSVAEVGLVLGLVPALFDRLAPLLTVAYDGDPDPAAAGPVVLAALRAATGQAALGGTGGSRTVAVTAAASGSAGGRFVRHAVVRLGGGGGYQVLDWRRLPG